MTTVVTSVGINTIAGGKTGTLTTIARINPSGIATTDIGVTTQGTVTTIQATATIRIGDIAGQWRDAIGGDDIITDTTDTIGITRTKKAA